MRKNSKKIVLLLGVGALLAVVLLGQWQGKSKYPAIEEVKLCQGYPPFAEYKLRQSEIDTLVDELLKLDFETYEQMEDIPGGDSDEILIQTENEEWRLLFLRPYLYCEGTWYEIGIDHQLWDVANEIAGKMR